MKTDRELLEQALKLVAKYHARETILVDWEKSVIEAINARLAEDDEEPFMWFGYVYHNDQPVERVQPFQLMIDDIPLFRRPRLKARLTDDEISQVGKDSKSVEGNHTLPFTFARAIEQKIWEKTNG